MKALLPVLLSLALASMLTAQTCREVVRDASGRIVQTIDRQKSAGGSVQATTRDASGTRELSVAYHMDEAAATSRDVQRIAEEVRARLQQAEPGASPSEER